MDSPAIETRDLTKSYGRTDALRGLNLRVGRNRITGFLGRNGAGKSTTIKLLLGMIRPSCGGGKVLGLSIAAAAESREMRRRVAYVAENKALYGYMTVEQMIRFTASFYGDWRADAADRLVRDFELPLQRKVKALSKGMRTKLALLLAFARRAELLILDEPTEGLDPVVLEQVLQMLVALAAEGATIFFSSHQIAEVERVADHVCILDKGRLLVDASMDQLRQQFRRIDMVFPSEPVAVDLQLAGVEQVRTSGRQMTVFASGNTEAIVERARDFHAVSVEVAPIGLCEVFLETVKGN